MLAVYRQDEAIEVFLVSMAGNVLLHDELPAEGHLRGYDMASKVMLAASPGLDGAYALSYTYRQARAYGTIARAFGEERSRWNRRSGCSRPPTTSSSARRPPLALDRQTSCGSIESVPAHRSGTSPDTCTLPSIASARARPSMAHTWPKLARATPT